MELQKKKIIILLCGITLCFFTSMGKVIVPGAVFTDLQTDLGLGGNVIASFGAFFMYAYAAGQLCVGVYSDRWGGVRLLIAGGSLFCTGSLIFPLVSSPWLMCLARAMAGLGSGTVFLGVTKLIGDLFPQRFAAILGLTLFITYWGPVAGTFPTVKLAAATTWRIALLIPAGIATAALCGIFALMRGTLEPVQKGGTITVLRTIFGSRANLFVFWASGTIFGAFYPILSIAGQKSLEDCGGMTKSAAAIVLGTMAILVACGNLLTGPLLKLSGNRPRRVLIAAIVISMAGSFGAACCFDAGMQGGAIILCYILITLPAGLFSLFCQLVKSMNPPQYVAVSVAMLNFSAFVLIAVFSNVTGWMLGRYDALRTAAGYPPQAYVSVFAVLGLLTVTGLAAALLAPDRTVK